jgi:hypothetical protein
VEYEGTVAGFAADSSPPTLMLFSTVDDRSGMAYQEYRCVYREDAGAALRFLLNAMAPKPQDHAPFQGIPRMIYMDNGPVARSQVFHQVMRYLDVPLSDQNSLRNEIPTVRPYGSRNAG